MTEQDTNLMGQIIGHSAPIATAPGLHQGIPNQASGARLDNAPPVHDWQKRYTDLQSYKDVEINKRDQAIRDLEAKVAGNFKVPRTAEELTAFQTENPDLFATVQTIAHQMTQNATMQVHNELSVLKADKAASDDKAAVVELQRAHPDAAAIGQAPEFAQWVSTKGPKVQDAVYNNQNDAESLSMVISLFKQETQWNVQAAPNQDLMNSMAVTLKNDSGSAVQGDPRLSMDYVWSEQEINSLSHTDLTEDIMNALDLAQNTGRVR